MSLTPEQLFQQALHDHASGLATVADPSALGGRLRHRDKMVKVYRGCLAGGAVVVLVAGGLFFTGRRHDELRTAGSPEPTSTSGRPPGTPRDTGEMILGDGTESDPTAPGSTILLGEDPGTTVPPDVTGGTTTTTNPLAATTTTTTTFGLPTPTLPNGQPDPDPTTPPSSTPDQPATTQPGASTTQPVAPTTATPTSTASSMPSTTAVATIPPTSASTTTTKAPEPCSAAITPPSGPNLQSVTLVGRASTPGGVLYDAGGFASPNRGTTSTDSSGQWRVTGITVRVPTVGQMITITVTCPDGSKAFPTYTRAR